MIGVDAEELFRKLRPVLGKQIDSLWVEYLADKSARSEIEEILGLLALHHLRLKSSNWPLLLPPPPPAKSRGAYTIGTVTYADRDVGVFGLRESEWIQHLAIFGRSGSGKTNVGFLILRELLRHGKSVWIFDWKRNYRDVARQLGVGVLTVGRNIAPFRFNPLLAPPGTEPETWLKKLVEIMAHAYGFRQATAFVLERTLFGLGEQYASPTVQDLRTELETIKKTGREGQWVQSAKRVVGTLCFGPVSKVLSGEPSDLVRLLSEPVIFELDALTDSDKTFLVEALLLWLHQYRMQQRDRERFRHATIIEEAHHILLKHTSSRESVIDIVLREIRELGEAVILLDQHPSLVSTPALGNTYCTIAMNTKHGADVATLGSALRLSAEARDYLGRLPVGSAIVRLQGRWQQPFLVKFPLVEIDKGSVGDDLLRASWRDSATSAGIPDSDDMRSKIRRLRVVDEGASEARNVNEKSKECLRLLMDVLLNVACGVAGRYSRLGLSAAAGTGLKREVLSRGWAREGHVRFKGRNITCMLPTSAGIAALHESGWQGHYATPDDRAGTDHEFWKAWLFEELRKARLQVQAEHALPNGHRTDLFLPSLNAAIEIETGKSNVSGNVSRLREAGVKNILIVSTTHGAIEVDGAVTISAERLVAEGVANHVANNRVA